jgi:hypothetical protein
MRKTLIGLAVGILCTAAISEAPAQQGLDISGVAQAIGRMGTSMPEGVYRVSFPRSDLRVAIGDLQLAPGFALGSYAAFKAEAQGTLAVGDLVLLPLHFWAVDSPEAVATGLKDALSLMAAKGS